MQKLNLYDSDNNLLNRLWMNEWIDERIVLSLYDIHFLLFLPSVQGWTFLISQNGSNSFSQLVCSLLYGQRNPTTTTKLYVITKQIMPLALTRSLNKISAIISVYVCTCIYWFEYILLTKNRFIFLLQFGQFTSLNFSCRQRQFERACEFVQDWVVATQ